MAALSQGPCAATTTRKRDPFSRGGLIVASIYSIVGLNGATIEFTEGSATIFISASLCEGFCYGTLAIDPKYVIVQGMYYLPLKAIVEEVYW